MLAGGSPCRNMPFGTAAANSVKGLGSGFITTIAIHCSRLVFAENFPFPLKTWKL
jgi:hypothetical protein